MMELELADVRFVTNADCTEMKHGKMTHMLLRLGIMAGLMETSL